MNGCITDISVEGSFTPLERIVLTANGNLQRILRLVGRELNFRCVLMQHMCLILCVTH